MGYYKKADLPFYYDLAQKFTICDNYFCSVLGPTHPNRLMQMTGTLDPSGEAGGPILVTNLALSGVRGTCSWTTMPEVLQSAGITWKAYNPHGPNYAPTSNLFLNNNVLTYFDQIVSDPTSTLYQNAFGYYGPNVSWWPHRRSESQRFRQGRDGGDSPSGVVDLPLRTGSTSIHPHPPPWVNGGSSRS